MFEVSVIIPSKVGESRLLVAVESIYDENLDMEILVGIDGIDTIMQKNLYALQIKNLKVFEFKDKVGISNILNALLELAEGKFIARMDADDVSLPQRLIKQHKFINSHPEVTMICSNAIEDSGPIVFSGQSKYLTYRDFFDYNPVIHPTVMFRKSELLMGNFMYNSRWDGAEDYDLWTRISRKNIIYYSNEPLLQYTKTYLIRTVTKRYFYFKRIHINNLVWHLFQNSLCPKPLLMIQILKVFFSPFEYLKIIVWNKINSKS